MSRFLLLFGLSVLAFSVAACADADNPDADVTAADSTEPAQYFEILVPQGRMVIRLYNGTPQHRDNFGKLADEAFFDSTTFHRVIANFMIQGGDPNSKDDDLLDDGGGGPGYTIPAELHPSVYYHKRGAVAAARLGDNVNPERESSGSQFYIVHGNRPYTDVQLDQIEQEIRDQIGDPTFAFSAEARRAYLTEGGAPSLDGGYTVFGELVEGFDVLDAIATSRTVRYRFQQQDSTLMAEAETNPLLRDQRMADQPPERVWMTVRRLPDYFPPESQSNE